MRLQNKTALIAGAARNIGKAIALTFAREGADLILVARKSEVELQQVVTECERSGVRALPVLADVGDPADVNRVVELGLQRFGKVDVLVSVAGFRMHKPFWEIGYEEWLQVFAVNLHATFYFAKALAPVMKARGEGGSIIALGGMASLTAQSERAHVVASKTGLYGLIKALALELAPYGVRANLIAPSTIDTGQRNPAYYPESGGARTQADIDSIPLGRLGTPQDVANAALFLASAESAFITGDCLICAGGKYM